MTDKRRATLDTLKSWSEIFSNFASPIATVVAAAIAVIGATRIADTVVARGDGVTAISQPLTGTASGAVNAAGEGATLSPGR